MAYQQRQKPCKSFLHIPLPKCKESWYCNCGGLTSELFCPNCGKSKYSVVHHKKIANHKKLKELASYWKIKLANQTFSKLYNLLGERNVGG